MPNHLPHVAFDDVLVAATRIAPHVHRTPIATSASLNAELNASVFFKCENLQRVGAFKARGATNAVLSLPDDEAASGVVTQSSGNHGQALAYAAAIRSIPCVVVVPRDAPRIKVDAIEAYGADVVFCEQHERDEVAARVVAERGGTLIHPFDNPMVIAGQGTAALELAEDVPDLDMFLTPIGGGGLLSGTSVTVRGLGLEARLVGAEPVAVDDSYRSIATGVRQPRVEDGMSIADGLLTGIGELTFDILLAAGAEIVTVEEAAIVDAGWFHLERMKLVVEPSGATAVAALRKLGAEIAGARVGVVLSGGNTDFGWLCESERIQRSPKTMMLPE